MGRIKKYKRLVTERANKRLLGEAEMSCPQPTTDSELNTKNKEKTTEDHQYGFPSEEIKEKGQKCGNCIAFDQSPRMEDCMGDKDKELGYCWMHKFMCSEKKWCDTWVEGGPIRSNKVSYKKQER
jgi:hypothetical protein